MQAIHFAPNLMPPPVADSPAIYPWQVSVDINRPAENGQEVGLQSRNRFPPHFLSCDKLSGKVAIKYLP
jgi:hypothetical protein